MITEILAYISVGLLVIAWLTTIILDLIRKVQSNTQEEKVKTEESS
jgi:hypothetical protein